MKSETTVVSGGVGIFGLLGVAFVIMRIMGIINWSWWLVLLPFYGGFILVIVIVIIVLIFILLYNLFI